jgi:hypothetical protein
MKKLFRDSSVLVKPMFCITPKTFYAINMISSFWFTFFFANYYMVTSKRQRGISMPVISIIKGTRLCIMLYQLLNNIFFSNSYLSIPFQNAKNNNFPSCSPSSFSMSLSAKCRFVTFYFPSKWFSTLFLNTQQLTNNSKKLLNCFITYFSYKPQPINRNTQNEIFQKFPLVFLRYSKRIPNTFKSICISTFATLKSAIFAFPCPVRTTFRTLPSHRNIFYKIFGPFSLAITNYFF